MSVTIIILFVLAIVLALIALPALSRKKYRVDYCGQKAYYKSAMDSYRAGSKVTVYYCMIASDCDYTFTIDGEPISCFYDGEKGFEISFTMPAHDVTLQCTCVNTMEPTPEF